MDGNGLSEEGWQLNQGRRSSEKLAGEAGRLPTEELFAGRELRGRVETQANHSAASTARSPTGVFHVNKWSTWRGGLRHNGGSVAHCRR